MALEAVAAMVSSDAAQPRVAVSGNAAVPWQLLRAVDAALPAYRLFMLNAPWVSRLARASCTRLRS
jgi:hypothetical protein